MSTSQSQYTWVSQDGRDILQIKSPDGQNAANTAIVGGIDHTGTGYGTLAAGGPFNVAVPITSAQLLALNSSFITLVAAPGAGKVIMPSAVTIQYKAGTTAYTITDSATDALFTIWGTDEDNVAFAAAQAGFIDQSTNQLAISMGGALYNVIQASTWPPALDETNTDGVQTAFVNTALTLAANDAPTLGNGTLVVYVTYGIITLQ